MIFRRVSCFDWAGTIMSSEYCCENSSTRGIGFSSTSSDHYDMQWHNAAHYPLLPRRELFETKECTATTSNLFLGLSQYGILFGRCELTAEYRRLGTQHRTGSPIANIYRKVKNSSTRRWILGGIHLSNYPIPWQGRRSSRTEQSRHRNSLQNT